MIEFISQVAIVVFVVGSMAAMGLSLTFAQIRTALSNPRLITLSLLLNFVLAPLLAVLLIWILSLDVPIAIGLVLTASAAGAPFLPKLVAMANDDVAAGVGVMVLLMVVTVVFMPIALPLVLPGVVVDPIAIARSLFLLMVLPLLIALVLHSRYGDATEHIKVIFSQASSISLLLLAGSLLIVNFEAMIGLVGTHGLIAAIILFGALSAAGYLLGGPVLSLATGQRNTAAAMIVAGQNFGPDVITYVTVASIIGFVVLFPLAGELGRRRSA